MKKLIFSTLFLSLSSYAGVCPDMRGQYHCILSNGNYSLLIIEQQTVSKPDEQEVVQYSFDYTAIPGAPEVFSANNEGIPDGWGWINRCANGKIRSMPNNGSMMSELYLNTERGFVYSENGRQVFTCPRKSGT